MTAARRPDDAERLLYGVHPVLEALESRPSEVERVLVARETGGARLGRVLRTARDAGVPVSHVPRATLVKRAGRDAAHQGIAAVVAPLAYSDPAWVVERVCAEDAPCLLVIDGVEDPGNLGALLRSAAAAGVHGILLGRDGTVGVTPVAIKASAGTAGRVPIAREGRLSARLGALAEAGFRVVALDPRGDIPWNRVDLTGPVVIVAGGEGRGLRPGILQKCTDRIAIPLADGVESLNVSVATGVVLFEVVRQRADRPKPRVPEISGS